MSDKKYVQCNVGYVKCDAKGCDYKTTDVCNDTLAAFLNKPCPDCGENLLTEEDFQNFKSQLQLQDLMNSVIDNVAPMTSDEIETGERHTIATIEGDGKGGLTIDLTPPKH